MRYKALSPFVRAASERAPSPPSHPQHTGLRTTLLALLSIGAILTPVAFTVSDTTVVVPVGAQAEANSGRNGQSGPRSEPPGQTRKSEQPTAGALASDSPTPIPATPTPAALTTATPLASPLTITAPTAVPTATPIPTQGVTPAPASAPTARCSTSMPATASSGWRRVMSDNFSEDVPLGEWGKVGGLWQFPGGIWRARPAGYTDSSGRGTYNSPKTTTQHDSLLDVWIHSEGATRYVAAPIPLVGNTTGQRISLCMRADAIPGYKTAFLLWPSNGPGNYHGEIDFPEGKLLDTATVHAYMHFDPKPSSGKRQDAYDSGAHLQQWHIYTVEWQPGLNVVSFYVDGRLFGRSERPEVPDGPMHYVMQMETYLSGDTLPPPAEGHVLVDWFTIDLPTT